MVLLYCTFMIIQLCIFVDNCRGEFYEGKFMDFINEMLIILRWYGFG